MSNDERSQYADLPGGSAEPGGRGVAEVEQAGAGEARMGRQWFVYLLMVFSLIWVGPALACGSFAPRPTPSPTVAAITPEPGEAAQPAVGTPTPLPLAPPATDTPAGPTPTFTPTPLPGTALMAGQPARVAAAGGLNLREEPRTDGQLLTRLGLGQRVTVVEGPVTADGFTWWRVDDEQGNAGWAAQGDGESEWLTPQIGEAQPVSRSPRVGDRVRVTTEPGQLLTVRTLPGTGNTEVTRVQQGQEFTVIGGPQSANGFLWFQIRSDDGQIEGWAADGNDTTRWLSPLE